jgi:hypothetical protein
MEEDRNIFQKFLLKSIGGSSIHRKFFFLSAKFFLNLNVFPEIINQNVWKLINDIIKVQN